MKMKRTAFGNGENSISMKHLRTISKAPTVRYAQSSVKVQLIADFLDLIVPLLIAKETSVELS